MILLRIRLRVHSRILSRVCSKILLRILARIPATLDDILLATICFCLSQLVTYVLSATTISLDYVQQGRIAFLTFFCL